MKYDNGEQAKLGDFVDLGRIDHFDQNDQGTIVVMIEEGSAMPGYNIDDWAYLKHGCIVRSRLIGDIRYKIFDGDTVLISRLAVEQ